MVVGQLVVGQLVVDPPQRQDSHRARCIPGHPRCGYKIGGARDLLHDQDANRNLSSGPALRTECEQHLHRRSSRSVGTRLLHLHP